jgi:LuxR family maltose regulon positive regulatory protein
VVSRCREQAHGYAAIAAGGGARSSRSRAPGALAAGRGGACAHRAAGTARVRLDRCGERALPLLREATDLARTYGLLRVFEDAHPALGEWAREAGAARAQAAVSRPGPLAAPARAPVEQGTSRSRSTPSLALTPKEREVLELLTRNLSNKEIGLAMQVGEETKWHMKTCLPARRGHPQAGRLAGPHPGSARTGERRR